ncbi:MAG: DUF1343 domain-containing protein [Opitutales bacterium]|nr:DUF1343 domain-containing protein [Opitutales bacterium]NRA26223.1 DUF1343 domain-containing protein [Opitutales bacterium]
MRILAVAAFLLFASISFARIELGVDVLQQTGFDVLSGQRVGLLTHPAGVNRFGTPTVDVLRRAPMVELVALFGSEHGIYGNEEASQPVDDKIDSRTGLPVYSLYGKYRKPTPKMLANIDTLVIDLQDIGVRSYTYVSCMRLALEACFEEGKSVVILDRPNPLGGLKVDGPSMDEEWRSYVGTFPTPYVHGMTIGELARMAVATPSWLDLTPEQIRAGELIIVPMRGWNRSMLWPDTGLEFVATSPNIPDVSAVLGYSMTGLGAQLGNFSHGIGTPYPFRFLRFKGKSPEEIQGALNREQLPGLSFPIIETRTQAGIVIRGVYARVDNWAVLNPTQISFAMMKLTGLWQPEAFQNAKDLDIGLFNKHVGSSAWWDEIFNRTRQPNVDKFLRAWETRALAFQKQSKPYWLYP